MGKNLCPCCGKHCYLDEVQCERGAQYRETGVIPPRKPRPEGAPAKPMPEGKRIYMGLDRDGKVVYNIRDMAEMAVALGEGCTPDGLLSCLRGEDRAELLMLLEKLRHDWMHRLRDASPEKTEHKE